MWPRSSIPRVRSMVRYTCSRSSRSRPASRTSLSEPTGSARWAIATSENSNGRGYDPDVSSPDGFGYDRFLVDQLVRPVANLYRVTPLAAGETPAGAPVAFVRQKKLAIRENIRFFADESESQELFHIQARQWLDTGGSRDDVVDALDGAYLIAARRRGRGRARAVAGDGDPAPRDRLRPGVRWPDPDPVQLRHPA